MLPISILFLIAVNMIPLFGVLFFGWSLFSIMFLYWIENGIIGFFNIFKIALARTPGTNFTINGRPLSPSNKESRIIFFIGQYGFVWTVHGVLVYLYFGMSSSDLFGSFEPRGVAIAATALFLSHGVSFLVNFLGKEEYLTVSPDRQMIEPYSRVLVLTVTILWGGFFVDRLRAPVAALIVLVLLKTVIDLLAHLREHRKAGMRSYPRPEQLLRGG